MRNHPLATVMVVAIALRLVAAVFSKGYMASDDHFESVHVAYKWLQDGLWGTDGHLHWKGRPAERFPRFPLYTVALYLNMKVVSSLGFSALDKIMYGVRFAHGLFSLLAVWAVYRIVEMTTRSRKWAAVAGLFLAAHFLMPFLSVRNLIEVIGGTFWILALYFIYRYRDDEHGGWLAAAGVATGLAWMVRFPMIFAFWIVPVVLWFEYRTIRPAVYYGVTVLAMLLLAGVTDLILMGTFMGSTINHVVQNLNLPAVYQTPRLIYPLVILAYFIPPFSIIALVLAGRKSFFKRHLVLTVSTLAFIVVHTFLSNRQERYMIPIMPALVVIMVLSLHHHVSENGFFFRSRKSWYALMSFTVALNVLLLIPFTFNYWHKGLIEPLVRIERNSNNTASVFCFSPEQYRNLPFLYLGFETPRRGYVFSWEEWRSALPQNGGRRFDYFILYPIHPEDIHIYVDSLSRKVGPVEEVSRVEPSIIDKMLHRLNPDHNPCEEAWVYRRVKG